MSPILTVVLVLVAAAVAGALGFYLGGENRKRTAEAKIGSAEEEAKRILKEENVAIMCAYMLLHYIAAGEDPLRPLTRLSWAEAPSP